MSTTINRRQALVGAAAAALGASLVGAAALGERRSPAADPETLRLARRWHEARRRAYEAALITDRSEIHPLAAVTEEPLHTILAAGREYSDARRALLAAKPHGIEGAATMLGCAATIFRARKAVRTGTDEDVPGMVFEWQGECEMVELALKAIQDCERVAERQV